MKKIIFPLLLLSSVALSGLQIEDAKLRRDIYPHPTDKIYFVEGWVEPNQYFPRYFKLAGTIQAVLKNDSEKPLKIVKIEFDGKDIGEQVTRPDFAGEVIWYRVSPEVIEPGGYGHLTIRLRNELKKKVLLSCEGRTISVSPDNAEKLRILYVAFNKERNRLTVFVESLENTGKLKKIFLDGQETKAKIVNDDFAGSNRAVAIVELQKPLAFGSFFILRAETEHASTFDQIRTRSGRILRGIIGHDVGRHLSAGFNLNYWLHGAKKMGSSAMTNLSPVSDETSLKEIAGTCPGEQYIYGNSDEPDAHEPEGLPYMERCGVNIMHQVEPLMAKQRRFDPVHPTALMIDSTYAPLNWYVYGAVPDIPFHDCYVPSRYHGLDSEQIARESKVMLSAMAPRAPQMMLWALINTGWNSRATTPLENELQYYYALGSGIKGIHYFNDLNTFPRMSGGGYYIGCSRIAPLWRSIARGNALIDRMEDLLNNACPWDNASCDRKDIWCASLLSGDDTFIVTIVNRNVGVSWMDIMKYVHTKPAPPSVVAVSIPKWFVPEKLLQVDWDKTGEIPIQRRGDVVFIPAAPLAGGRMYLLSSDKNIECRLKGTPEIQHSVAKIQEIPQMPRGIPVNPGKKTSSVIRFAEKTNEIVLDFSSPDAMEKAAAIRMDNALLERFPKEGLRLIPGTAIREAYAELTFFLESDAGEIIAELCGETVPGYDAGIQLDIRPGDAPRYVSAKSFRNVSWHNGKSPSEKLCASVKAGKQNRFEIRISLRDPFIIVPDGSPAAVRTLTIKKK